MRSSCFFTQRGWQIHPIGSSYLFSSFIHICTCVKKGKKRLVLPPASRARVEMRTLFLSSKNVFLKTMYINLRSWGVRILRRKWKLKGGSLIQQYISRNGFFINIQRTIIMASLWESTIAYKKPLCKMGWSKGLTIYGNSLPDWFM